MVLSVTLPYRIRRRNGALDCRFCDGHNALFATGAAGSEKERFSFDCAQDKFRPATTGPALDEVIRRPHHAGPPGLSLPWAAAVSSPVLATAAPIVDRCAPTLTEGGLERGLDSK